MKFVLVFALAFIFAECQENLYSLNPRSPNVLLLNAQSSFDEIIPRVMLYQPSWRHNLQENGAQTGELQSPNSPARIFLNSYSNPGVYVPPTSGSGMYSPNNGQGYYNPAGPFWLKTRIYTTFLTTTVTSLSYCIPVNQLANQVGNPTCARRRREVAQLLDALEDAQESLIDAAPVNKIETTALIAEGSQGSSFAQSSSTILSSKDELAIAEPSEADAKRTKRLFNIFAVPMTVTSYVFATAIVQKPISPCSQADPAIPAPCLSCVPPGYALC